MTTIITSINVAAAIRAGSNAQGFAKTEIDVSTLTDEQRAELVRVEIGRSNESTLRVPTNTPHVDGCVAHTSEAALAALGARIEKRRDDQARLAKYEAEKRAQDAAEAALRSEILAALRSGAATITRENDSAYARMPGRDPHHVAYRNAQYAEFAPYVTAEFGRLDAIAAADLATKMAADRIQSETLRRWALEHGSETLRLRIEMRVGDWESLADSEYTEAYAPNYGGQKFTRAAWTESGDTVPRKKPIVAELRALKAMREACAAPGSIIDDPKLLWCTVDEALDDDGEVITEAKKYCILTVDVRVPSRGETTVAIEFA